MNDLRGIRRHRTAMRRSDLSRPVKLAIADGVLETCRSFFDYGCGHGGDVEILNRLGFEGAGWDPVHRPSTPMRSSAIVNLGYVINVIEDPQEREQTVRRAFDLAGETLVVSARLHGEARRVRQSTEYGDGFLTGQGTFQKFYDQDELKTWIDTTLGVSSVAAGPGVFYVFRDDTARTSFLAHRHRRRVVAPRIRRSEALLAEHRDKLDPLMEFFAERGRLPAVGELQGGEQGIVDVFGSLKRAWRTVARATGAKEWLAIEQQRSTELLIFLGLSRFEVRPKFSGLPTVLRHDVRSFFGTYKRACADADDLLFSIGRSEVRKSAVDASPIGKRLPSALYVHESALAALSPQLQLLEGCARALIGRVEGANLIKLHRDEPKVSYLSYPDFETDPHPALAQSLSVHLQTFRVREREFDLHRNPPILHRKEAFLEAGHPFYEKFARLTRIEEEKGLYDDTTMIGRRDAWNTLLARNGLYLRGHRLLALKKGVADRA